MEVKREVVSVPVMTVEERPQYTLTLDEGEMLDLMGALTSARVHLRQLLDRTRPHPVVRESIEDRMMRLHVLRDGMQKSRLQRG